MGVATGLWGMFTGLMTLRSFGFYCWRSVPSTIALGRYTLILSGHGGTGFWLFLVGICLKLTDVVAHLLVPTPAAKRQPVDAGLSFKAYMERCPEKTTCGAQVGSGSWRTEELGAQYLEGAGTGPPSVNQ